MRLLHKSVYLCLFSHDIQHMQRRRVTFAFRIPKLDFLIHGTFMLLNSLPSRWLIRVNNEPGSMWMWISTIRALVGLFRRKGKKIKFQLFLFRGLVQLWLSRVLCRASAGHWNMKCCSHIAARTAQCSGDVELAQLVEFQTVFLPENIFIPSAKMNFSKSSPMNQHSTQHRWTVRLMFSFGAFSVLLYLFSFSQRLQGVCVESSSRLARWSADYILRGNSLLSWLPTRQLNAEPYRKLSFQLKWVIWVGKVGC